jgi:hypothetical protein
VVALAQRGEHVDGSDAGSGPPVPTRREADAAPHRGPHGDHDLIGCLARLLAADLLTVEEFEAKRRRAEG